MVTTAVVDGWMRLARSGTGRMVPMPSTRPTRDLVLASTSRYRAELMDTLGLDYVAAAPDVDERALDHRFAELGGDSLMAVALLSRVRAQLQVRPCPPSFRPSPFRELPATDRSR